MSDSEIIGANIRRLRKQRGMTQSDLAYLLNITGKTVSKWECARGMPDITLLPRIAVLFNVSIEELMKEPEPTDEREKTEEAPPAAVEPIKKRKKTGTLIAVIGLCAVIASLAVIIPCVLLLPQTHAKGGTFRFEAENSVFRGVRLMVESNVDASNWECAAYMEGCSLLFQVDSTSDEDNAKLDICLSSCVDICEPNTTVKIGTAEVDLRDIIFTLVNNKQIPVSGTVIGSGAGNPAYELTYYNWCVVSASVSLKKGVNNIRLIGSFAYNVDYIELTCEKADLSWKPQDNIGR